MGIGASIFLLAVGAIFAFAVDIDSTPFAGMVIEWDTVGVILMVVGLIGLVWSIFAINSLRARRGGTIVEQPTVERETWVERP